MATRFNQVVAEQPIDFVQIDVTAAYGSAGQEVESDVSTKMVMLRNWNTTRFGIEYQVGDEAWKLIGPNMDASVDVDLSTTTLKLRRAEFAPSPITVNVEKYEIIAADPTIIVVSAASPSDEDGRPDGTIYIQLP